MPIAFHVDYFNNPWKDVFSDSLYSQRQMAYNELYTKPKNPEYGLYYTPMLMIDGEQSVNGRDPTSAEAAIRRALTRKPGVQIDVALDLKADALSGTATIKVTSRSTQAERSPILICAVLREDGVVTNVPSGENAGKALIARFPARQTKYEFIELDGKSTVTQKFPFVIEPTWNRQKLRLAVFVQDKRTGAVHQATDLPWRSTAAVATSTASRDRQGALNYRLRTRKDSIMTRIHFSRRIVVLGLIVWIVGALAESSRRSSSSRGERPRPASSGASRSESTPTL